MKNPKDKVEFSLKDQSSSTPIDTSQSKHTRTSESISQFLKYNSKAKSADSEDIDSWHFILYLTHFPYLNQCEALLFQCKGRFIL